MKIARNPIEQPQTSFLICASPRSGSTLLCEVLFRSGLAGRSREAFNPDLEAGEAEKWGTTTYAEFYQRAVADGLGPDGVFGTKLMWMYMERVTERLRSVFGPQASRLHRLTNRLLHLWPGHNGSGPSADPAQRLTGMATVLDNAFPNLHYIWITRRDKVDQAISLHRALQTEVWLQTEDEPPQPAADPAFDFEKIDGLLHNVILGSDSGWQHFFAANGIQPICVEYDELVADNEGTARRVLAHLGIHVPADHEFAPPILRKQSDALSRQWAQQYREMAASQGSNHASQVA